ncbi:hypothetical protein D9M71_557910 [compost metagenome]
MFQVGHRQRGVGLVVVVGLQPHQIAAPALFAAQAQHGGAVEGLACGQVIGTAAVKVGAEVDLAEVHRVALDQEAVTQGHYLAAAGNVHAIFAQRREQVGRAPAQVQVLDGGAALVAQGQAGGIAIAPGSGAEQVEGAVEGAAIGQSLAAAEAVLGVALLPGGAAGLAVAGQVEAFVAVEGAEQGFEVGVEGGAVFVVQLVGLGGGCGQQQGQCAGECVPHGVLHGFYCCF